MNALKMKSLLSVLFSIIALSLISCATMSPKKQLTMSYGIYNSQYASYMTDTGYVLNDSGEWEKVKNPVLTEDQKDLLRQKKKILTQMYPLLKVYDSMVVGTTPFSAKTEQELLNLIDQLAKLIPE